MGKIADVQLRSKAAILAEEGYSYSVIGDKLGRSKGWVAKWVERSKQGELGDHARCGRPKILTQAAIKIIKKAKYRRGFGLRQIEKSLKAGGLKGNKETIRNYMKVELKWRSWKRRKAPLLTDAQKKKRLLFARQHRHWKFEDWSNVLFSDESPYQVFYVPNSRNDTVWGSQEENVPVASQVKFSPTVLVWGGMTASGLTRLHFVPQHTSINSEYYINNILKKELKPVYDRLDTSGTISKRRLFTDNAVSVFQQDGARAHTSAVSRAWLNENIPNYIENWPPNSPDLSPIENLWSILSSSVYKDPEPKTPAQLKRRLRKAWNSISLETLYNLIESLPRRMKAVIASKGNTIAY